MKTLFVKLCPFLLFLAVTSIVNAQQGNVSAGGSISGTGGSMSYSVGQTDYLHYTSEAGSISFGLQQPWFEILGVPPFLDVPGTSIGSGESLCFNATGTVIIGGSGKEFIVEEGGHADIIAGENILLKYGTSVKAGGSLHARISTEWCFPDEERHLHPLATVYDDATPDEVTPAAPTHETLYDPSGANIPLTFKVYPNPGNGIFTIDFQETEVEMLKTIMVFSLMGELIIKIENHPGPEITINIMNAKPGIYLARVQYENVIVTEKLIKH